MEFLPLVISIIVGLITKDAEKAKVVSEIVEPIATVMVAGAGAVSAGGLFDIILRLVPMRKRLTVLGGLACAIRMIKVVYDFVGQLMPYLEQLAKRVDKSLDKVVPNKEKK